MKSVAVEVDRSLCLAVLSAVMCSHSDVLVGTPGRLADFVERGRISLSQISYLCLDEADRMLDMGFEPAIRNLVMAQDMTENRQTLMFSATFPKEIQRLAQDFLYNYIFIAVGRVGASSDFITQNCMWVEEEQKRVQLMQLLPNCKGLTLIFVERKKSADLLETYLNREGERQPHAHAAKAREARHESVALDVRLNVVCIPVFSVVLCVVRLPCVFDPRRSFAARA
jgi:ATP-dependent RNA helicase DDX3X